MIFKTWTTVAVGNLGDVTTARKRLRQETFTKIDPWADHILDNISFEQDETMLDLVLMTGARLGMPSRATQAEFFTKTKSHGLLPCPGELAVQILLQIGALLQDQILNVAMDAIVDSKSEHNVFCLSCLHDQCHELDTLLGNAGNRIGPAAWVFARKT